MMTSSAITTPDTRVQLFHASLLWPLQIEPSPSGAARTQHWEVLNAIEDTHAWRRIDDEFTDDPGMFRERHYREFVSFLPYVQRFLYGDSRAGRFADTKGRCDSPMHVFRRKDIATLRLTLREGQAPVELDVVHMDLYFFDDLDLVQFNVEVSAKNISLDTARDILFRFGRAYPSGWDDDGQGLHNVHVAQWIGVDGQVVAQSDSHHREKFLKFVCQHRSPCISEHWACLLRPLVLGNTDEPGLLRYRLIEYHRMPVMAFLAIDQPRTLSEEEWIRIGLASMLHPDEPLPVNEPTIKEFEPRYCQDRFWTGTAQGPNTRFMCTGNSLTVVGDSAAAFFTDAERGVLAQFRHQYFLIFLLAHLHRAALLVFSDILVGAVNALNVRNVNSVRAFKRCIRSNFETFLRFTHRYWFHELSERPHVQATFRICATHLRNDALYDEVRDEIKEMSHYLDSDSQRRQSNTVVRLTVITILGLIATVTTGYFGMNIIPFGEGPALERMIHGVVATIVFIAGIVFAISRSRGLSEFLEVISDERAPVREKIRAFWRVLSNRKD
jgi:CorA-like Mg2+ transporter protein